jgi:hypothetical protein
MPISPRLLVETPLAAAERICARGRLKDAASGLFGMSFAVLACRGALKEAGSWEALRSEFELHEKEAKELLDGWKALPGDIGPQAKERVRYPVLAAYDHCLKCSHLFNLMDARGVISVTERAALMQRVVDPGAERVEVAEALGSEVAT